MHSQIEIMYCEKGAFVFAYMTEKDGQTVERVVSDVARIVEQVERRVLFAQFFKVRVGGEEVADARRNTFKEFGILRCESVFSSKRNLRRAFTEC